MRDYKRFVGRQVNVVTTEGDSFQGTLDAIGTEALFLESVTHTDARTREDAKLAGTFIVDRVSIHFVQVL